MEIILKSKSSRHWFRSLGLAVSLTGIASFAPSLSKAGTGGVEGGCAFPLPVNGQIQWKACTGLNLPMWYSASNPTYNQGELPCGEYGNQNCGSETGDPMSE